MVHSGDTSNHRNIHGFIKSWWDIHPIQNQTSPALLKESNLIAFFQFNEVFHLQVHSSWNSNLLLTPYFNTYDSRHHEQTLPLILNPHFASENIPFLQTVWIWWQPLHVKGWRRGRRFWNGRLYWMCNDCFTLISTAKNKSVTDLISSTDCLGIVFNDCLDRFIIVRLTVNWGKDINGFSCSVVITPTVGKVRECISSAETSPRTESYSLELDWTLTCCCWFPKNCWKNWRLKIVPCVVAK